MLFFVKLITLWEEKKTCNISAFKKSHELVYELNGMKSYSNLILFWDE